MDYQTPTGRLGSRGNLAPPIARQIAAWVGPVGRLKPRPAQKKAATARRLAFHASGGVGVSLAIFTVFGLEGPRVRIRFAPAESLQTIRRSWPRRSVKTALGSLAKEPTCRAAGAIGFQRPAGQADGDPHRVRYSAGISSAFNLAGLRNPRSRRPVLRRP